MGEPRSGRSPEPAGVLLWWEGLETWQHLMISFPIFAVLMLVINIGPFSQPLGRSIFYGLFEGAIFSGLLAVATATERGRRRSDK